MSQPQGACGTGADETQSRPSIPGREERDVECKRKGRFRVSVVTLNMRYHRKRKGGEGTMTDRAKEKRLKGRKCPKIRSQEGSGSGEKRYVSCIEALVTTEVFNSPLHDLSF